MRSIIGSKIFRPLLKPYGNLSKNKKNVIDLPNDKDVSMLSIKALRKTTANLVFTSIRRKLRTYF